MQTGVIIGRDAPPPDGRQTRIDFFLPPDNLAKKQRNVATAKTPSFDLLKLLTSWFRQQPQDHPEADLTGFKAYLQENAYSKKSCSSYLFMLRKFFAHFERKAPASLSMGDIEDYNYEYFVSGRYSRSYQLQFINAVRLYYLYSANLELNLKHLRKTGSVPRRRK